jgi:pyruvate/2-oxoglutarate dehydrogenase complex dihydrolipoamide dehydrogenase (E3) component
MKYHTIVVGAGSAGLTVAVGLSKLGKRVALVERRHVGGDCTNYGCIPSKTLIHESKGDEKDVLALVRLRRDHLRDEETEWIQNLKNVDFHFGQARFLGPNSMEVIGVDGSPEILRTKNVVLATGSRPRVVAIDGLPAARTLTNETMFEQKSTPEHLVIVGGGVIGMEMAFGFRRLGSRVTVVDRGERVLKVSEPAVSDLLLRRMNHLGIESYFNTVAEDYEESSKTLRLRNGKSITGVDKILSAAGRIPNLDLDLERAGVIHDERGVPTEAFGRTNIPHIFAIGDINHRSAFTHSANDQGRRLVKKLALPFVPFKGKEPYYPSATFTDPEVAQVGPSLSTLLKTYPAQAIHTETVMLKDTDRGYTMGLEEGFVMIHSRVLTGEILSATIAAPSAGEMISLLTFALNNGVTLYKLAELVFPYPVLSEAIKKASSAFVFHTLATFPRQAFRYLRYRP